MKLSRVYCSRGASMGRAERHLEGDIGPVKFHLQTVVIDSGGYDEGGAYWGLRLPQPYTYPSGHTVKRSMRMYWYWWNGNKPSASKPILIQGFLDAWDRQDAKDQIRDRYPQATFYR